MKYLARHWENIQSQSWEFVRIFLFFSLNFLSTFSFVFINEKINMFKGTKLTLVLKPINPFTGHEIMILG